MTDTIVADIDSPHAIGVLTVALAHVTREWRSDADYANDPDARMGGDWDQDSWGSCLAAFIVRADGWTTDVHYADKDGQREFIPDLAASILGVGRWGNAFYALTSGRNGIGALRRLASRYTGGVIPVPAEFAATDEEDDD